MKNELEIKLVSLIWTVSFFGSCFRTPAVILVWDSRGKKSTRNTFLQAQLVLLKKQSPGQAKLCWSLKDLLNLCFVADQAAAITDTEEKHLMWVEDSTPARIIQPRMEGVVLRSVFQNSSFRVFLAGRSTCRGFIHVAESHFGNIANAGVMIYTRPEKDVKMHTSLCVKCIHSWSVRSKMIRS